MQKVVIDPAWTEEEKWRVLNGWIAKLCGGGITRENIQSGAIVGGVPAPGEPVPLAQSTIAGDNMQEEIIEARHLSQEFNDYLEQTFANAEDARTLALGKNTVYRQTTEPTSGDYINGDVWFKIDTGTPPNVVGIYMYLEEMGWVLSPASGAIIAAATITAEHFAAINLTAESGAIFNLNAERINTGTITARAMAGVYGTFTYLYTGLLLAQGLLFSYNEDTPLINFYDENHDPARIITSRTDHIVNYGKTAPWESADYIGMADYAGG